MRQIKNQHFRVQGSRLIQYLLFSFTFSSFAGLIAIAFEQWQPASKWWVFLIFIVSLSAYLLWLNTQHHRMGIITVLICLAALSSAVALHQTFPFSPIASVSLQALVEKYPAPQIDDYILYSYINQHYTAPFIFISDALMKESTQEELTALAGAAQVQFIQSDSFPHCNTEMENAEVIPGFFGQSYTFSNRIQPQEPVIFIFQSGDTIHVVSEECVPQAGGDSAP